MISAFPYLISIVFFSVAPPSGQPSMAVPPDITMTHAQPIGIPPTAREILSKLPEASLPRTKVTIRCEFESYSKKVVALPLVGPVYEVLAVYQCHVSSSAGDEVIRIKRRNLLRREL